jgi:hypothetical protein
LQSERGSIWQKHITKSCNLTPQTVTLFVPKSPPACCAVELGVRLLKHMEELVSFLSNWQTLIGAFLGGVFALFVALLVSYKAQRREEISSGYLIIGNLASFTSAIGILNTKAEKSKIPDEEYNFWLCEHLLVLKPSLSSLYEASVSRIIHRNNRLGAHLDLIRTFSTGTEAPFSRINEDIEYHYLHGKHKRSEEHIRADASIVVRGYNNIVVHSECAIYLIPRLVTSNFPTWYLFKSYFFPNELDKKSMNLILTGKT